jgi:hypothetical protein
MQCALDTQNLSRPFPITWKWGVSRVLFWLPLLENRDSQNNSGQSWCCLLFHSINVPKMWSTPNSEWSSLWVFWHYNLLGCDLEKCLENDFHFPCLGTEIFLRQLTLSNTLSSNPKSFRSIDLHFSHKLQFIFTNFTTNFFIVQRHGSMTRQTIMSLKKTNFY